MIEHITGNVFDTTAPIIAHGCNCVGGFGSGVAGYIAQQYPSVRQWYRWKFKTEGWKLGDIQPIPVFDYKKVIINCATQHDCGGDPNVRYVNYDAIATCMEQVRDYATNLLNNPVVAIPKIGAGLANGDWSIIEEIIGGVFSGKHIQIYTYA